MPKNMLKNLGRFELLELIYNMRKENLELKERCETAERKAAEAREDADRQIERARKDYENRIEELRMQGAAKDLQIRMKKIEEQLRLLQKLTSVDVDLPDLTDGDAAEAEPVQEPADGQRTEETQGSEE